MKIGRYVPTSWKKNRVKMLYSNPLNVRRKSSALLLKRGSNYRAPTRFHHTDFLKEILTKGRIWSWIQNHDFEFTIPGTESISTSSVLRIRGPVPFLTPGCGMGKNQDPDLRWTTQIIFPRVYKEFFGWKYLNSLMRIRDGKFFDPGSGINLTDPQRWTSFGFWRGKPIV